MPSLRSLPSDDGYAVFEQKHLVEELHKYTRSGLSQVYRPKRTLAARVGSCVGLPDLPYFTGDPVFQTLSPASRKEAAGKNKSPVFC